ncbi:uncharacterized protein EV154DRAFT_549735 [Mucor mucedo]|uniref:uncharacterized protein n=1 Tax=Mucor mucedo TaxID=29922 RepID=UPI00221F88CC|nr:uncharacterized protein EV154DRAFT_549735 [Mucor mucedo]KAI7893612.1 hypothetical protein EV154DRAFT_549735 [Mucor mucedo]
MAYMYTYYSKSYYLNMTWFSKFTPSNKPIIEFCILLLTAANYVIAKNDIDNTGSAPSCGYLAKKIFCFGVTLNESSEYRYPSYDSYHVLDIRLYDGVTTDELVTKWAVLPTKAFGLGSENPQFTSLPDGKTLLIVSGTYFSTPQTLAFNGESLTWEHYKSFNDPIINRPFNNRAIGEAAFVYVPEHGFVLYGGIESGLGLFKDNFTYPGVNTTNYIPDNYMSQRFIGYTKLEILDIRNKKDPWRPHITEYNAPKMFPCRQAAIFDAKNNIIFFFGGQYSGFTSFQRIGFTFDTVVTFNFTSQSWGNQILNGQGPSPRIGHTATLVGPNQRNVLIYGGRSLESNRPLSDYCYTLDLDSFQWTPQTIPAAAGEVLTRSRHSAVTITNDMLFILFGFENETKLAEKLFILNVTNPSSITLMNKFVQPSRLPTIDHFVIGVSVSAAGLMVLAVIVFCISKKRKNKKKMIKEPPVEVDWDKIQETYAEDPNIHLPEGNFNYIPQVPDIISTTGTTIVPNCSSPLLPKTNLKIPDAIDCNRVNSVERDPVQNFKIGITNRDQVHKPDISFVNKNQEPNPGFKFAEREQIQKPDIE